MKRPGILWFVLDAESSQRLRQAVPPLYTQSYYHHVTLLYGIERSEVEEFIGKPWTIEAYATAHNKDAQACRVRTNGLPDTYGAPHITLSAAAGIKPFASVAMLKAIHDETPLDPPMKLSGTLQFIYIDEVKD